jgi:UDP-N-acetylmuramate dehydrogenase
MTWFRVGGPAETLFRPADLDDLAGFLAALPPDIHVTVIGVGSNLLVRDGGIPGVTVRLGRGFVDIRPDGEVVETGAGALDLNVALTAAEAGIADLEFLSGIPGTIGGGFRTNAGAYGREFKDALISADALDRRGELHRLTPAEMGLSYRHSDVDPDWIFVRARFKGSAADPAEIGRRMTDIRAAREASQPIRARTGGSTFANPPGHQAWKLIDEAGCRGLTRGDAMVSERHTNFDQHRQRDRCRYEGSDEVRRRVHERGVMLRRETAARAADARRRAGRGGRADRRGTDERRGRESTAGPVAAATAASHPACRLLALLVIAVAGFYGGITCRTPAGQAFLTQTADGFVGMTARSASS